MATLNTTCIYIKWNHILLFTVILILVIRVIYSELSSHKMQTASRTPILLSTQHTHGSWEWERSEMRLRTGSCSRLRATTTYLSGLSRSGRQRLGLCGEAGGGALAGAVEAEHGQPLGEGVAEPAGRPAPGPAHAHPPALRRRVHGGGVLGRDDGGVGVGAAGAGAGEQRRRERERLAVVALGVGAVPGGRLGDARAVLPGEGHRGGAQRGEEEAVVERRGRRRECGRGCAGDDGRVESRARHRPRPGAARSRPCGHLHRPAGSHGRRPQPGRVRLEDARTEHAAHG